MCRCHRHSTHIATGHQHQARVLSRGLGSRSHGQRPSRQGLRDPGEEELIPPVDDPGEEEWIPPEDDPDGLYGGRGGGGLPGGQTHDCGCGCRAAETVYVPTGQEGDESQQPAHLPEVCFSGFIIVRLAPASGDGEKILRELIQRLELEDSTPSDSNEEPDEEEALAIWPLIRNTSYQLETGPLKPAAGDCEVRGTITRLAAGSHSPRAVRMADRLLRTWRIDGRLRPSHLPQLVSELQALSQVELAYREVIPEDPNGNAPVEQIFSADQGYRDDAPVGIGARCAEELFEELGDSRRSIRCCDVEQRWITQHAELMGKVASPVAPRKSAGEAVKPFFGDNRYTGGSDGQDGNHGTAVGAQLIGGVKIKGLARDAIDEFHLASHYDAEKDFGGNVAEAVINTLVAWYLNPSAKPGPSDLSLKALRGSVLMIEVQRCGLPAEVDHADFEAFSLATALGVVVVEAGGNAGYDLDSYQDEWGRHILRRGHPDFRDSGAVLVGAAWSNLPHDRASFSNFGSRVDCYGWGDSGVSAGYGDYDPGTGEPECWYTSSFSGTSCATPIVAAAAAWVQCLALSTTECALPPSRVRALLADRATGTPQGPNVDGNIGVMPDLCAILNQADIGAPQAFLRRTNLAADWTHCEITCSSPDIIVTPGKSLASAKGTPGEVGDNRPAPGLSPIGPKPVYIHCNARNRGLGAVRRRARLYFSRAATLINPHMWKRLGSSGTRQIEQGGQPTSLGGVRWEPPGEAHFAFLANLIHRGDPDPLAQPSLDWPAYWSFLKRADVACRNTHWLEATQAENEPLQFSFTGAFDRQHTFDFEIVQRLPADVTLQLEVPQVFAIKLRQSQPWAVNWPTELGNQVELQLPPRPQLDFRRIRLPVAANYDSRLWLIGKLSAVERRHSVTIRQLYRGGEVGRLTCFFR